MSARSPTRDSARPPRATAGSALQLHLVEVIGARVEGRAVQVPVSYSKRTTIFQRGEDLAGTPPIQPDTAIETTHEPLGVGRLRRRVRRPCRDEGSPQLGAVGVRCQGGQGRAATGPQGSARESRAAGG